MYEIETKSKPRRAQGGKGILSHSISVQSLKNSYSKPTPREEKGGREGGAWEGAAAVYAPGQKRERESRGREGVREIFIPLFLD